MFDNVGSKIKGVAQVITWIGIIASVIGGFSMIATDEDLIPMGLLIMILGSLLSWLSSLTLYGLGQLIENSDILVEQNRQKNSTNINNNHSNNAVEKKQPQSEKKPFAVASVDTMADTTKAQPIQKKYVISPIKISPDFVDVYNWESEISKLDSNEIYARYSNAEKWSEEYRQLCFLELQSRNLVAE